MAGNLKPGDVTTLGNLRPGDVATIIRDDGTETDPVVVRKDRDSGYVGVDRPDSQSAKGVGCRVRYLGRGRIEPAKIVMDSEPDRIAELEAQVRTLREACEYVRAHECYGDRFACPKCYQAVKSALAATAPKGGDVQ